MPDLPPTPASSTSERVYSPSLNGQTKNKKKIEWSPENEKILVEWCDVAQCYKWLNTKSHNKYSKSHANYTIPAIVLSTITGTASFAQSSLSGTAREYAPMIIGTINIAIGILATLQQYLKISELNEAHRVASIAWDKFARNIRIEIAKAPDERPDAGLFLKYSRDEYDRLMETSPTIPEDIIKMFIDTFSVEKQKDPERKRQFKEFKRPDICDVIISAEENRHHWYKELSVNNNEIINIGDKAVNQLESKLLQLQEQLLEKEHTLIKKEGDMENKIMMELNEFQRKQEEYENKMQTAYIKIEEFVNMYSQTNGRNPIKDEIQDHFANGDELDFIDDFMMRHTDENV
jgi:hypothetical protein